MEADYQCVQQPIHSQFRTSVPHKPITLMFSGGQLAK